MHLLQILILAIVQGAAELLPVSSSAHVIVAEKLMGLDPTAPAMTMLLVMLHTGTMFAAIVYFWKAWIATYFSSFSAFRANVLRLVVATAATGVVGLALLFIIKHLVYRHASSFEIEHLFGNATLMAVSLAAAGVLIILASRIRERSGDLTLRDSLWIGAVQGLCLPFRGFSRSGATISTGLALGVGRRRAEEFSFALAVVLTPPVIVKEAWRLYQDAHAQAQTAGAQAVDYAHLLGPSLIGMVFSFLAGLVALRWLSKWLEQGRWSFFGIYCLLAAVVVLLVG
ncbi:MAG TPA: undecaprenyl-diphosphate phosphatase [Bordetella sp.]